MKSVCFVTNIAALIQRAGRQLRPTFDSVESTCALCAMRSSAFPVILDVLTLAPKRALSTNVKCRTVPITATHSTTSLAQSGFLSATAIRADHASRPRCHLASTQTVQDPAFARSTDAAIPVTRVPNFASTILSRCTAKTTRANFACRREQCLNRCLKDLHVMRAQYPYFAAS